MPSLRPCLIVLALLSGLSTTIASAAMSGSVPAIDKQKLESYLRYAEGFTDTVKFSIGDPEPLPFPGYFRLPVHLSMGEAKQDKTYYLTADGNHIMPGPVWDVQMNPFAEMLSRVPANGPSFGPADARITIVVFSDLQCPYCREFARTLRQNLPQKYPHDVRVVFKDFPIASLHPWAMAASEAAHCLGDGNSEAFWLFHDWIFEHQGEINGSNLREKTLTFAREHKLDEAKIAACIDTHATKAEIEKDLEQGRALDVQQTPTFFLNGRMVPGAVPWTSLNTLIQMELHRPSFIPGPAAK